MKVEVIFDPMDLSVITVKGGDLPPVQARERVIGQRVGPRPTLPEHLTPQPAHESRLLKAAVPFREDRATLGSDPSAWSGGKSRLTSFRLPEGRKPVRVTLIVNALMR